MYICTSTPQTWRQIGSAAIRSEGILGQFCDIQLRVTLATTSKVMGLSGPFTVWPDRIHLLLFQQTSTLWQSALHLKKIKYLVSNSDADKQNQVYTLGDWARLSPPRREKARAEDVSILQVRWL